MILLMWLIAAYGMSQILVYGSIFTSLREGIHKLGDNPFTPFQPIFKFISHLMTNIYQDIHEIIASFGMNILVFAGFLLDYKEQRKNNNG